MTQLEYEQKKRECFVKFCKDNGIDQEVNISIFDAFDQIFDRAYAFGKKIGNSDFSDAEEEGILTVPRKDIVELFQEVQKTISKCKGTALAVQSVGIKDVLWSFFGSKCLPDNVDSSEDNVESSEPNVDSLPQNPTENCDNKSHISADCNKPAEPKFKRCKKIITPSGEVCIIEDTHFENGSWLYLVGDPAQWITESDLEPYTEPTDFGKEVNFSTKKQSRNLSQESANCDKEFDNILKNGFREHNRLHIAAMMMQGLLANPNNNANLSETVVDALNCADALIAEVEKGNSDGED